MKNSKRVLREYIHTRGLPMDAKIINHLPPKAAEYFYNIIRNITPNGVQEDLELDKLLR
jgi:hypothetical protein